MGRPGFEPETSRLKAECSTAELATLELYFDLSHYTLSSGESVKFFEIFWGLLEQPAQLNCTTG